MRTVTAPPPAITARERYLAGLPPRDRDECQQYAEYDLLIMRAAAKRRAVRRER